MPRPFVPAETPQLLETSNPRMAKGSIVRSISNKAAFIKRQKYLEESQKCLHAGWPTPRVTTTERREAWVLENRWAPRDRQQRGWWSHILGSQCPVLSPAAGADNPVTSRHVALAGDAAAAGQGSDCRNPTSLCPRTGWVTFTNGDSV